MQQGGSQYGVPPPPPPSSGDMTTHMFTGEQPRHMAEAVPPINTRAPTEDGGGGGNYEELTRTVLSGNFNEEDEAERGGRGGGGGEGGAAALGNRWPREETLTLIKIRSDMDATFRDSTLKGMLWEDVSRKLEDQGYKRSAKKCKEKFENVHKYYKRTKEGRAGRQDGKNYRFFAQLEALHNICGGGGSGGSSGSGAVGYQPTPLSSVAPITTTDPIMSLTAAHAAASGGEGGGGGYSMSTNSSSSESDGGDQNERKRKRRTSSSSSGRGGVSKKTISFFKVLMKQLMDQQASMQQRFLETIEKREQDRMIREEAWKRQEMSRLTREHEAMAQERAISASRDAAIINFLQKYTGQKISIPVDGDVKLPQAPVGEALVGGEVQMGGISSAGAGAGAGAGGDPAASSRWPKAEVHVLIKLRSGLESRYRDAGPKGPLWEEISAGMKEIGYNRNAKRCKEKWENINKYFKKVKESNKKRPEDAKTCPYFHQLDALYRKKSSVIGAGMANIADDNIQEPNLIPTLTPPSPQPMDGGSNVQNVNGGTNTTTITITSTVPPNSNGEVRRNSGTGEDSEVMKPEHMMKEMIHAHVAMDEFDKHSTENIDHDDDGGEEDNNDDDDDEDEDDEEQKMAYKIEYQRTTVDNTSNGGTNQSTTSATGVEAAAGSFLAMVQ